MRFIVFRLTNPKGQSSDVIRGQADEARKKFEQSATAAGVELAKAIGEILEQTAPKIVEAANQAMRDAKPAAESPAAPLGDCRGNSGESRGNTDPNANPWPSGTDAHRTWGGMRDEINKQEQEKLAAQMRVAELEYTNRERGTRIIELEKAIEERNKRITHLESTLQRLNRDLADHTKDCQHAERVSDAAYELCQGALSAFQTAFTGQEKPMIVSAWIEQHAEFMRKIGNATAPTAAGTGIKAPTGNVYSLCVRDLMLLGMAESNVPEGEYKQHFRKLVRRMLGEEPPLKNNNDLS